MSSSVRALKPETPWSQRLAAILASSIALPLIFEIVLALLGGQDFHFGRAAITIGVVGLAAALLYVARPGWLNVQRARAVFLILAGLGVATHGFLVTALPEVIFERKLVLDTVGMLSLLIGMATFALGCFYFQVEDVQEAIENPTTTPVPAEQVAVTTVAGMYSYDDDHELVAICERALTAERLHYIAYYEQPENEDGTVREVQAQRVFSVDVLAQPKFRLRALNANRRRELYHEEGPEILAMVHRLDQRYQRFQTGPLIRVVLDVEQGAIYYYEVSRRPARHLVAVTLDQEQVYRTDDELAALTTRIRRHFGLLPHSGT